MAARPTASNSATRPLECKLPITFDTSGANLQLHLRVAVAGREHLETQQSVGRHRVEQRGGETGLLGRPDNCHAPMLAGAAVARVTCL